MLESDKQKNQAKMIDEIISAMPDLVVVLDTTRKVLYANSVYAQQIGVPQAELIGKSLHGVSQEKIVTLVETKIKEVVATKKAVKFEAETLTVSGVRYFESVITPIFREDGSVALVVGTTRDITEQHRVEETRNHVTSQLQTLHEISDIVMSSLSAKEVSQLVADYLGDRFDLSAATILLLDETRTELVPSAMFGYSIDIFKNAAPITINSDYEASHVFNSNEPSAVEDIDSCSIADATRELIDKFSKLACKPVKSYIAMPLKAYKEKVGTIAFFWPVPVKFSPEDIDFFMSIANEVSIGIENARLYEAEVAAQKQAKDSLETSNLLLKAANAVSKSIDLEEVLDSLADTLIDITGKSRITFSFVDEKADTLVAAVTRGTPALRAGEVVKLSEQAPVTKKAVDERRSIVIDYAQPDVAAASILLSERLNIKTMLITPLVVGDKVVGILGIDEPGVPEVFTEKEISLVDGFASQAAIAIENARLYRQREEELARTKLLQDVAVASTSSANIRKTAERILAAIRQHLALKIGFICVLDETKQVLKGTSLFGLPDAFIEQHKDHPNKTGDLLAGKTIKLRQALTHEENVLDREKLELLREIGIENDRYITIPIEFRDEILGVIGLVFEGKRAFTKNELDLFHAITHTIGQAIENARLFEIEHNIANTLQSALLTIPDKIEGIEFGHLYRAARETAQVGGDFYDLFELENKKIGIVIGDVSGKGLDAAVITSRAKNALKAFSYAFDTPEDIMFRTNNMLAKNMPANIFVTLFFGIIDTVNGELTYCSAGHPPVILKRASGVEMLETLSPIIGAFPGIKYTYSKTTLRPGDVLVLYTDGITESRCDGEFFGEQRLVDFIKNIAQSSPKRIPQLIFDEVLRYTNGKLSDDLALLTVSLATK